jgi:hypothetical protein
MKAKVSIACLTLISICLLSGCGDEPNTHAIAPADIAITDITIIDATNGSRQNMTVRLRGDQIIDVAPSATINATANQVIDGRGKYLIPGLWDMHVHITYEPALIEKMPDLFLDYGITSVRDTGGMLPALLPEIEKWRAVGAEAPRIFFSGPLLDGAKVVYDGRDRPQIGIANADAKQAAANVADLAAAGVDFIKIYELVSPTVFDALVAAADQHGLPIAAHVPLALDAGTAGPQVGTMEHLRNIELACASDAEDAEDLLAARQAILLNPGEISGYHLRSRLHNEFRAPALEHVNINSERCSQVIQSLKNTIQVPTLRLNTIPTYSPLSRDDWLTHLANLPPEVASRWQATAQSFFGKAGALQVDMVNWSLDLVGAMNRADVPIGAGTDTPIGQAIPGYSLHTELERLVEAGLSPLEALTAATVRPAEFLGLEATYGTVQPGKVADLVILTRNPLADIRNTRAIESVISKGQVVR